MGKKHAAFFWNLGIALLFLWLAAVPGAFKDRLEYWAYDAMSALRVSSGTPSPVALVDIDDHSLETLGPWPWPRSRLAEGIRKTAVARVVGLPLMLNTAQERLSSDALAGLAEIFDNTFGTVDDPKLKAFYQTLQDVRQQLGQDRVLADAITSAGNVVLPVRLVDTLDKEQISPKSLQAFTERSRQVHGALPGAPFPRRVGIRLPLPEYLQGARHLGPLHDSPDRDGKVRRAQPAYWFQGRLVASYSLSLAAAYLNIPAKDLKLLPGNTLSFDGRRIPLTGVADFFVFFDHSPSAFARYSFADLLSGELSPAVLADKLVIFNLSATGLGFRVATPRHAAMPAGELAAHALRTILQEMPLLPVPYQRWLTLVLVLLAGLTITMVLPRFSVIKGGLLSLAIILILAGGSAYSFIYQDLWIQAMLPSLAVLLGFFGTAVVYGYIPATGQERAGQAEGEIQRLQGMSFHTQGLLDESWDKLRPLPVDESLKSVLYELAMDIEKRGDVDKALAVYEHIEAHDAEYRDIQARMTRLVQAGRTVVLSEDKAESRADMLTSEPGGGTGKYSVSGITPESREDSPTANGPPKALGRYELIKPIGQGAMGTVFLGKDPRINRETAIKTYRFDEEYDPGDVEQMKLKFFREAESAGKLSHPGIVTIFDAGEQDQLAYIAMEFLDGEDLRQTLKKGALLPMREVIDHVADIAEALAYAHRQGVVHRDIKPANIMLLKTGDVKITDFGIARIVATSKTRTGVVKGTPYYMAPEQITGKKVDGRCDIFSLGVVLFQLLTGRLPFTATSPGALMHKIVNDPHPDPKQLRPAIITPLVAVINRALEKDVTRRYQDAGLMAANLRKLGQKIDAILAQKKATVKVDRNSP